MPYLQLTWADALILRQQLAQAQALLLEEHAALVLHVRHVEGLQRIHALLRHTDG
jgi:hypothetical protein